MVNHVSKFAKHLASKTKPLRELLRKKNTWHSGQPQEQAFKEIKEMMTSGPILALCNPNKDTKVNADASLYGIGRRSNAETRGWNVETHLVRLKSSFTCGMQIQSS